MFQIGRLNIVKSECIKIQRDLLKKKKKERARERLKQRDKIKVNHKPNYPSLATYKCLWAH